MIDKFNFYSHESTCIHIPEIHLLCLSKNFNGIKQLCKNVTMVTMYVRNHFFTFFKITLYILQLN